MQILHPSFSRNITAVGYVVSHSLGALMYTTGKTGHGFYTLCVCIWNKNNTRKKKNRHSENGENDDRFSLNVYYYSPTTIIIFLTPEHEREYQFEGRTS